MFGEPIINTGSPKELLLWDSRCVIRQTIGRDTKTMVAWFPLNVQTEYDPQNLSYNAFVVQ